jgi:hypothetical protein
MDKKPEQSEAIRAWGLFLLLSHPENRTPERIAEARTYVQIIFIEDK